MNLTEPDHFKYPVEEFYRVRDIRWLFLFYIERYIFNMNSIKIDKFCKIREVFKLQINFKEPVNMTIKLTFGL